MALRTIRVEGDPVLTKISRPVDKMTPRIHDLITDMLDTMYEAMGVGLAAPQVGILKRVVVIDVGDGPIILINPEIIEKSGEQTGDEGCLSVPGMSGQVTRPDYVKVKALNEDIGRVYMKERDFWPVLSAMNWIIWMDICIQSWWRESFTGSATMKKTERIGLEYENSFYGNT